MKLLSVQWRILIDMPFAQLPLALVPPRPPEIGSPLAHQLGVLFLAPVATTPEALQTQVGMCLALAAGAPFDPEERIVFPPGTSSADRGDGPPPTLLHAVLTLGCLAPPAPRSWPMDLEGFVGLPIEADESPVERLAAVLVAAGCSPWTVDPAHPELIPRPVRLAAKNGMAGLFARFLETPDAWPIQVVANAPTLVGGPDSRGQKRLLKWLSSQEDTGCLEWLLARGARPWEPMASFLLDACPEAASVLKDHGLQPKLDDWEKFRDQWRDRIRRHLLLPEEAAAMARLWWGAEAPPHLSAAAMVIDHALSQGWDPSGLMLPWHNKAARQLKPESLVARGEFTARGLHGEWSALAAAAFSLILVSQQNGGVRWSVNGMANGPLAPGSLAGALGFDWRPGIPVDGLLALALFGQCRQAAGREAEAIQDDWDSFAEATGLPDVHAWAQGQWGAAAAATLAFTSGDEPSWRRHKAGFLLTGVWATCLWRLGPANVRDALDMPTRADVLMGLAPGVAEEPSRCIGMGPHAATGAEELTGLAADLFPELAPRLFTHMARTEEDIQALCDTLTDPTLSGPTLRAFLAQSWASQGNHSTAGLRMTLALGERADWPPELIADLQRLWQSRPPEDQRVVEALLAQRELARVLPMQDSDSRMPSARKPRL